MNNKTFLKIRSISKHVVTFVAIFFALFSQTAVAVTEVGLITGSSSGTYIQFGNDMARLMALHNVRVNLFQSKGSLENVAKVLDDDKVHMGLVQSDVLAYIQASNHKKIKVIPQKIKLMFPLYNEEVHLLANHSIHSFKDLQNKTVAVGVRGSGTNLTSELLFELMNVWPQKKVLVSGEDALAALQVGEIDAMFYVSGYPVKLFDKIDGDKIKLVPINELAVQQFYTPSLIPKEAYRWQASTVQTVAVKAVLMTYDFSTANCAIAHKMTELIKSNLPWLVENGHPKWQEVDLDVNLSQWERLSCLTDLFVDANVDGDRSK